MTTPPEERATLKSEELLAASPDDYLAGIVSKIERAGNGVRHAVLTNHQAAHLLAWANIARNAALSTPAPQVMTGEREKIARALCAIPDRGRWWENYLDDADAILSLSAEAGWREIERLSDRVKIGSVWRDLHGNHFATISKAEGATDSLLIALPAPPAPPPAERGK